ncbi:MAG TPA: hypothetical protein VHA33_21320 [Candidatus Angelobacter sp.]|nr:hypothetical protein [Candidatus Angelobacter sp.]
MSHAQTIPTALPMHSRSLVVTAVEAVSIPWTICLMVTGITISLIGGIWDFAWHMSIGRDTFWTPPHILVQSGGILVGIASIYAILTTTLSRDSEARDAAVRVLGLRGPGGAFIAIWGSLAMLASAPFDNWWHNAYGLDVQLVTPPHGLLSLGYFATKIGAMIWMASIISRSHEVLRRRLALLFIIVGSICMALTLVLIIPFVFRSNMHTAQCYLAVALSIPTMMIATGRGSVHKWGCTIVAASYTTITLASEWLLPLIPAQPKLGPVYHNVTHLIPLQFPLLLIVPALIADLLLQRLEHRSSWTKAACIGPAFILSFLAVQWPFANFLVSQTSRNWVFGTAYFSYFDPAGFLYDPNKFEVAESTLGAFMLTMLTALVVAIVTTRLGLGWGDWMRRVRR